MIRRIILTVIFLHITALVFSCSRSNYYDELSKRGLERFYFSKTANPSFFEDIDTRRNEPDLYYLVPNDTDTSRMIASYDFSGCAVFIGKKEQISGTTVNDFSAVTEYIIYSGDGKSSTFSVEVKRSDAFISSFDFTPLDNPALKQTVHGSIRGNTIWFDSPHDISLKGLVPSFSNGLIANWVELDGDTAPSRYQRPSMNALDFSAVHTYRVFANQDDFMDYRVSAYRLTALVFFDESYKSDCAAHISDGSLTDSDGIINDEVKVELPYSADLSALRARVDFMGSKLSYDDTSTETAGGVVALDYAKYYKSKKPMIITVHTPTGLEHRYRLSITKTASPSNDPDNPPNNPPLPDGSDDFESDFDGPAIVERFTLSYDVNGGTGSLPAASSQRYNVLLHPPSTSVSRSGYALSGWNSSADGTGTFSVGPGAGFSMPGYDLTLYAQWQIVHVSGVSLNKTHTTIGTGASEQLIATVLPANAEDLGVTWSSSDNAIATVSATGLVTAHALGDAIITVTTSDGGFTASCKVVAALSYSLGGEQMYVVLMPDIATSETFPRNENDAVQENVPARFIMGETEVSYRQWYAVYQWATDAARGVNRYTFAHHGNEGAFTGATPKAASIAPTPGKNQPVAVITWRDSIVWCNALTEYYNDHKIPADPTLDIVYTTAGTVARNSTSADCDSAIRTAGAKGFRLPSAIEWEFAARYRGTDNTNAVPGSDGTWYTKGDSASAAGLNYSNSVETQQYAWFSGNAGGTTHTIRAKRPNLLGLYDMSGNLYEFCFDSSGSDKIIFGGAYTTATGIYQGIGRGNTSESYDTIADKGFRVVRTF